MKRSCRIFSMILGLLLCVSLLTGCNTNKDPNTPKHTRDNGRKLTIYCREDDPYQKRLIDNYNAQADEKDQIIIQSYGAASDISNPDFENSQTQLTTDILSGGGPDLFLIDPQNFYSSLQSVLSNGAFQNLDYYFNKYPMDWGQYNSSIMEYGMYQGKRYLIPYMYGVAAYITTEETLNQYGIPKDTSIVHNRLGELLPYQEKLELENKKLFSSSPAMEFCANDFIDFEHKTHSYNSEEFKQIVEVYKQLNLQLSSSSDDYIFNYMFGQESPELICNMLASTELSLNENDHVLLYGEKKRILEDILRNLMEVLPSMPILQTENGPSNSSNGFSARPHRPINLKSILSLSTTRLCKPESRPPLHWEAALNKALHNTKNS